jgi:hypothetical protein
MPSKRRHKDDTATFKELDFQGQARSLNVTMVYLRKAIRAHMRRAKETRHDPNDTLTSYIAQIEKLKTDLEGMKR